MKKFFKTLGKNSVFIAVALLLAAEFVGCKNSVKPTSDGGGSTGEVSAEIKQFIIGAVKIPESGEINGADHDETKYGNLPGSESGWKGVFIKNRRVTLSEYMMSKTEVPYWLWKEVYDWATSNGYTFANAGKKGSDGSGSDKEPVTSVSWRDCIVWCNALTEMVKGGTAECAYWSKKGSEGGIVLKDATAKTDGTNFDCDKAYFDKSKNGFRLPTEAEWEYAAWWKADGTLLPLNYLSGATKPAGQNKLTLPLGETWETLRDEANRVAVYRNWWNGSRWIDQGTSKTAEVGTKAANALGLYDMSGNVKEWCWDWFDYNAAAGDGGANPVSNPHGNKGSSYRVFRGGGRDNFASYCVSGFRGGYKPDSKFNDFGFRLTWYK